MKNKIIIIILLLINIILIVKNIHLINQKSVRVDSNYLSVNVINNALRLSYLTNGRTIPNDIELRKLNDEPVLLSSHFGKGNTLLFIYSDLACNICIDSLIYNCNKLVNDFNIKSVVGIAHSERKDYLNRFVRINKFKFPVLWDKDNNLLTELNLKTLPVVILINNRGTIINSFYLNPDIHKLNSSFFESMKILL